MATKTQELTTSGAADPTTTPRPLPGQDPNAPVQAVFAPGVPVQPGDMVAASDSVRQVVREELMAALAALGVGKAPAAAEEAAKRTQNALEKSRQALMKREAELSKRLEQAVQYKATANGWVPSPVPGGGGLYVRKGEQFLFGGVPGMWMEAVDGEGEKRVQLMQEARAERAKIAQENQVAISALDTARDNILRVAQAGIKSLPNLE